MAVSKEYREFVVEQIERVLPTTQRAMFGGVAIYADGVLFALLAEDRIYLKVDETNRGDFVAAGMPGFEPWPTTYFELPGELLEDPSTLRPWLEKAVQVARNSLRQRR